MTATNQRRFSSGVLKFEKMADNRKSFAPSTKAADSTDLMREKLEKWRRMKGRSPACHAATVWNRSRSAVSLDINKDTNRLQKRKIGESKTLEKQKENAATRYKRISDHTDNFTCLKKRRKTFNVVQRKSLLDNGSALKSTTSNKIDVNPKSYNDKTLSMRERLELWRAEKGKGKPGKAAVKSKPLGKKLNKMPAGVKEKMNHYHRLENTQVMFTPASTKSILKSGVKSTTKKTAFVTPSHHKPSTGQSNSVLQSKNKSTVIAIQCETNAVTPSTETKSYKNKALDMRERLELWLAEKGKTPKYKTPAVLKHSKSVQRRNLAEEKKRLSFDGCEETDGVLIESVCAISPDEGENIEEKLQQCLLELEINEDDAEKVASKLDLYNSSCPHTCQIANYWLCRAKIAQQQKDYDRVVCLLEQAFAFKAQPESILKDAVCAFVNFMKENDQQDAATDEICQSPVHLSALNDSSLEELNSSIIKFCLMKATPYRKKFKTTFGQPILTPVRRSVRLERATAQYPSVVQEHGITVRTLGELPEDIQQNVLFKPNFAVRAELNEAWNKLQLDFNQ